MSLSISPVQRLMVLLGLVTSLVVGAGAAAAETAQPPREPVYTLTVTTTVGEPRFSASLTLRTGGVVTVLRGPAGALTLRYTAVPTPRAPLFILRNAFGRAVTVRLTTTDGTLVGASSLPPGGVHVQPVGSGLAALIPGAAPR